MNEQDQQKALAELDGWKPSGEPYPSMKDGEEVQWYRREGGFLEDVTTLPNYLTSYDAIIPLIQKQDDQVKFDILNDRNFLFIRMRLLNATPSQLSEALLRSTGKWKE